MAEITIFATMSSSRKELYAFASVALLIWIYLCIRAWQVPLVHDEIATFFHYIHKGKFLPYQAHWDANNHVLNSGLSVFFYKLFGNTPFVLRMANLLFFPLYAVYTFRLGKMTEHRYTRILLWTVLLFPHNLVEFMALSRGYGMSMALLLASVFHTLSYAKYLKLKDLSAGLIFLGLALSANLTLIHSALLICSGLFLIILLFAKHRRFAPLALLFIFGGASILGAALLSLEMKKRGLLYYGAADGFWKVTVRSLMALISGNRSFAAEAIAGATGFLCLVLLAVAVFRLRITSWLREPGILTGALFFGNISATVLLHYALGVNFPEDRTGMYFYYFLVLSVCFLTDALWMRYKKILFAATVLLLLLPFHFVSRMNTEYSSLWTYEHYPVSFYRRVQNEVKGKEHEAGIGAYTIQRLVWAYYNLRAGGNLNLMQTYDFPNYDYDYLLFTEDMVPKAGKEYEVLDSDKVSGLYLLKRRQPHEKILWRSVSGKGKQDTRDEYFNLFEATDSIAGQSLYLDISLSVQSPAQPFIAGVVAGIADKDGKNIFYEMIQLDWLQDKWAAGDHFHHGLYIYDIPSNTRDLVLYVWNIRKEEYSLGDFEVKVYKVLK